MLDAGTDNDRKIEDMQVGSKCRNKSLLIYLGYL